MMEAGRALHLVQGYSAAGALRQAFRAAGCGDEILKLVDDLSCGRIDRIDADARTAWWGQHWDLDDQAPRIADFWRRVAEAAEPIVVWAGRGSASEHCFLLAVAQALRGRSFSLIDLVPGRGGTDADLWAGCVAVQCPEVLPGLIGTGRAVEAEEYAALAARWEALQRENAPFRVVMAGEVVSVAEDYFDGELLAGALSAGAGERPVRAARVVGGAMGRGRAHMQVGDMMLFTRLLALVAAGRLVAEGNACDMRAYWVRLAE